MSKYLLGVDGGNTKTDICIFDDSGNFISHKRFPTCSHEALSDGYTGTKVKLGDFISSILNDSNIKKSDIATSAFGLAGIDFPHQQKKHEDIIKDLGFENFIACNDGFLGIKAGSNNSIGVCSVNGTGTVCVGLDSYGKSAQIGGIGEISSDDAGSTFISKQVIKCIYNELFRCHKKTIMTKLILELLDCTKQNFAYNAVDKVLSHKIDSLQILQILFDCADACDEVAVNLLKEISGQLAFSTAGCIRELNFSGKIDIILAGSVWCKSSTPILVAQYKKQLKQLVDFIFNIEKLTSRPVAGAVLWAYELLHKKIPKEIRTKINSEIEANLD